MTDKAKPNILFLMTDQQRPDFMGCYGNVAGTTGAGDTTVAASSRHCCKARRYPTC